MGTHHCIGDMLTTAQNVLQVGYILSEWRKVRADTYGNQRGDMDQQEPQKQHGKAQLRSAERVRVICIRNTDFCVCDGKVPIAIYSNRADADLHRQRLIKQQALA
jgi:hypothetical protein